MGSKRNTSGEERGPSLFSSSTAEGIESVEIVQVVPMVSAVAQNVVDLTVTCQGR